MWLSRSLIMIACTDNPAITRHRLPPDSLNILSSCRSTLVGILSQSPYGGIIASGFHTIGTSFRLFIDTGVIGTTGMGSPGMDSVRWIKPVRPGDTLRVEAEVLEARASRSTPGRGIILMDFRTFNQENELVLSLRGVHLVRRRNDGNI